MFQSKFHDPSAILTALVVVSGIVSAACAQDPIESPMRFRESVTVLTDNSVVKKVHTIGDYLQQGAWDQANEVIDQISTEGSEYLLEVSAGRYLSVPVYCQMVIAGFPPEALAAYRRRVDSRADRWLETGMEQRDRVALQRIVEELFCSSAGDDALWLLGEMAWERGDTSAARKYWSKLIPRQQVPPLGRPVAVLRYPDSEFAEPEVLARLILCSLFAGDDTRAARELAAFSRRHSDAQGSLAGRQGNLAEILKDVFRESRDWSFRSPNREPATFAGNAARNQIASLDIDLGAVRWSASLPVQDYSPRWRPADSQPQISSKPLSYFPVVNEGIVFLNDSQTIWAWELGSGRSAWLEKSNVRDAHIYPAGPTFEYRRPLEQVAGTPQYTMTVHEGRLYARMGSPITNPTPRERNASSEVICLDIDQGEGKLLWRTTEADLEPADQESPWVFQSSPIVAGKRAYVPVMARRPDSRTNVACLDADTGKLIWNQHVCASLANFDKGLNHVSQELLTLSQDTVFYCTGNGAIAALDAEQGDLRWLVTYVSLETNYSDRSVLREPGLKPCLFSQDVLIVAPRDSDQIMAFDADSGVQLWARTSRDRIRHLVGVANGVLIVSGNSLWGIDMASGTIRWRIGFPDPVGHSYGRGQLVGETVYWPTREFLYVIDQKTGRLIRREDLRALYGETGGNLVLTDQHLLIARPDRLVVYGENPIRPSASPQALSQSQVREAAPAWVSVPAE